VPNVHPYPIVHTQTRKPPPSTTTTHKINPTNSHYLSLRHANTLSLHWPDSCLFRLLVHVINQFKSLTTGDYWMPSFNSTWPTYGSRATFFPRALVKCTFYSSFLFLFCQGLILKLNEKPKSKFDFRSSNWPPIIACLL